MKVRAVTYNEDDEIDTIEVRLSLAEAAAIQALGGKLNGYGNRRLKLDGDDSLYYALSQLFNGHYEDGYPPGAPRIELCTLNDPL